MKKTTFSSITKLAGLMLAVLAPMLSAPPLRAASASPAQCAAIDDAAARLACYDRLHGRRAERAPPSAPGQAASAPEGARQAEAAPGAAAPDAVAEVVAMGQGVTGRHWFQLSDGRRWEQMTRGRAGIEVGDSVQVTRRALGTYHLREASGRSRSVQVRPAD